jgi:beta-lactam-binding protein with PASTA domain
VVNLKAENAVSLLESGGFEVELTGSGEFVLDQTPRPGTKLGADDPVHLRTGDPRVQPGASEVIVPNLQGLSLRRAMSRLMIANLDMRAEGSGTVLSQTPSPGEKVKLKTPVRLRCKPGSFAAGPN